MTRTVLIVDDEPLLRGCLKRALRGADVRVLEAGTGQEALEMLARESVDLLLTDYEMPGFSGAELVRRARRLFPTLWAAIVSGTPEEARLDLGEEATPLLAKPWSRRELHDLVDSALPQAA